MTYTFKNQNTSASFTFGEHFDLHINYPCDANYEIVIFFQKHLCPKILNFHIHPTHSKPTEKQAIKPLHKMLKWVPKEGQLGIFIIGFARRKRELSLLREPSQPVHLLYGNSRFHKCVPYFNVLMSARFALLMPPVSLSSPSLDWARAKPKNAYSFTFWFLFFFFYFSRPVLNPSFFFLDFFRNSNFYENGWKKKKKKGTYF